MFCCGGPGTDEILLQIEHKLSTPLDLVGLQVWRGSLLLADFLLHQKHASCINTVVELGAGPGVAGLMATQISRRVFLTDASNLALRNCARNLLRNFPHMKRWGVDPAVVGVRHLDWVDPPDWISLQRSASAHKACPADASAASHQQPSAAALAHGNSGSATLLRQIMFVEAGPGIEAGASKKCELELVPQRDGGMCSLSHCASFEGGFPWGASDIEDLWDLDLLLAADCIYDNDLTDCLMRAAAGLLRFASYAAGRGPKGRPPTLLVSLEKRVAFTLRDLDVCAPAYDYWRTLFVDVTAAPCPSAAGLSQHIANLCPGLAVTGRDKQGLSVVAGTGIPKTSTAQNCNVPAALNTGSDWHAGREEGLQFRTKAPISDGFFMGPNASLAGSRGAGGWRGRRLEVDEIPQIVQEYERGKYLELWELWLEE